MKQILLVCDAGMSTSILVQKMQKAAEEQNLDVNIKAVGRGKAKEYANIADVCLIGPQIKYALAQVQAELPDINVAAIDMRVYGMADGKKALEMAYELMK